MEALSYSTCLQDFKQHCLSDQQDPIRTLNLFKTGKMFRVFAVVLCGVFLSLTSVNCTLDDTLTELAAQLAHLAKACSTKAVSEMELHSFKNDKGATCNDGSPAGYYLRKSHGSRRWLVYLEGGGFCSSAASCEDRYRNMTELMTSKSWSLSKIGIGILSTDPQENPSWWNANHVLVPYCSSDAWSGNASREEARGNFSFLGTRILDKVIDALLLEGLYHSKHLLLAGSSAGGVGVILNLDRIAKRLKASGSRVQVRGLADSGWYLIGDHHPLIRRCLRRGAKNCSRASHAIQQGMAYWRGIVPEDCARRHPDEKWKCYFGEYVFGTDSQSPKHSPLFVFQWLYDIAQLVWTAFGTFNIPKDLHNLNIDVQRVLSNGTKLKQSFLRTKGLQCAVFAPSCISHTILTRSDWLSVKVAGKNLNDALDAWYLSSSQSSSSCTPLIESSCNSPHCSKNCPEFLFSTPQQHPRHPSGGIRPRQVGLMDTRRFAEEPYP